MRFAHPRSKVSYALPTLPAGTTMRRRLLLLCCLSLSLLPSVQAATLEQQRQYYDAAQKALAKGDASVYQAYQGALSDYPLEPYLAYTELTARLNTASSAEVDAFLLEHGDLPQIRWMKMRWLKLLAERGDWSNFIRHYDLNLKFAELDCLYGQALLALGKTPEGYAVAERLWMVGDSQPNACDPLFSRWAASGALTDDKLWQRTKLAVDANNTSLARALIKQLPSRWQTTGQLMLDTAQKPQLLNQPERFTPSSLEMGDAVGAGLKQLVKQNVDQATDLLEAYARRVAFSEDEQAALARQIGLRLAKRFDRRALDIMAQYDPKLQDATLTEWRARLLLRLGRWDEAYQLTSRLPLELASTNRWRYWQARSLELSHKDDAKARLLYQAVAQERDFYGFLSADRIRTTYQVRHQPMELSPQLVNRVRNSAIIRRAMEFYARGQITEARREWYHTSNVFQRDELVAQARMGYEMGWYFPAIRSISQAQYWDDLEVRFPMAHGEHMVNAAQQREIQPSWVFAITRQESAFMTDARSSVGASGLMQLMPATAQETAKRFGIPLKSDQQVLDPSTNIQLGAAYLSQVYGQFNGNRVLASAAYNAGPGRVRQWLKDARHLSFDVWIESIPFDETRQYVQNVLSYAVIYSQKLNNRPQPLVEWHERFFDEP